MRLFVAVLLERRAKEEIAAAVARLREQMLDGSFTREENLHLTLAFLGETSHVERAKQAVEAVRQRAFVLRFGGLGRFTRDGGDVFWLGVEPCPPLLELHCQLEDALRARGFETDRRPFRPHLTLGRRVVPAPGFSPEDFSAGLPRTSTHVGAVTLMKSERLGGRLVYTPLCDKELEDRR